MEKSINYINKLSACKFIIIASIVAYISVIPFTIIAYYINFTSGLNIDETLPLFVNILIVDFFGPILESFLIIFIIKIVRKLFKKNVYITTFISAIIFSCFHTYGFLYILALIIPANIFIFSYLIYENKSKYLNSYAIMTIIHILYNSYNTLLW